ncbi:DNA-formamidopyrimidine glycosylase family protein [Actinocorallia sp. A-T 12471]|uniref:DNA-formamidopyrimidine glycosylase family protein n=1 Tax=Actinocorallia sp. A-T 12471 TaxID=3089813 RepID=UPI0029CE122D|nr:DNA-formamidopyrimidine glycosylase family protein [Actinocorallia sp. A-T 12471]MDX6744101.1 DNA-formamidopyrimidine glycosylase family protein [Actinocorallia sp. A-T 12471]
MPEGDSVWRAARDLREVLAGHELLEADLRVPRLATADLTGRVVRDVVPRGKHLLIRFDGMVLHSHLLMDGAWKVYPSGARRRAEPYSSGPHPSGPGARAFKGPTSSGRPRAGPYARAPERRQAGPYHQIRAVLRTEAGTAVGYRVHQLRLVADEREVVGHLGPDLLGPDWDADAAVANLAAKPERPIGEALLDQRDLAGIGNIFKSEILFTGRTHPLTPTGRADLPVLVEIAHRLLLVNRERPRRVTTGSAAQPLWVYGRARRPCLRCGTPIRVAGQDDRVTYWCPRCQPAP